MTEATIILQALEAAYKRRDGEAVQALGNEFVLALARMDPKDAGWFLGRMCAKLNIGIPPTLTRWRELPRFTD